MKAMKSLLVTGAVLVGTATMGAGVIYAAQPAQVPNRISNLVTAIAQRFNLNPQDVQKVFDDQRTLDQQQMQQKMADRLKTRLDQAVKDGKLTQAQEDLIIAKEAEVKTFMASLKDKAPADRQAAIKTEMDSLKAWATSNNIPTQFFAGFGGRMGHPFVGRPMMRKGAGMGAFNGMHMGWAK